MVTEKVTMLMICKMKCYYFAWIYSLFSLKHCIIHECKAIVYGYLHYGCRYLFCRVDVCYNFYYALDFNKFCTVTRPYTATHLSFRWLVFEMLSVLIKRIDMKTEWVTKHENNAALTNISQDWNAYGLQIAKKISNL